MKPIRVCQVITELAPGGAERCVFELARRLDRSRFEVTVLALRGGVVAQWLADAGIRVADAGIRGKWDFRAIKRLRWLVGEAAPDVLHTHLFHADLAAHVACRGLNIAHWVHTVHTAEGRFRPWRYTMVRLMANRYDRIVAVSESVRRVHLARTRLAESKYAVIPNGVDTAAFARDGGLRGNLRADWGLGEGEVLAAYVGRLSQEKGPDVLVKAMGLLAARGRRLNLVVAGDGPLRGDLERFLRDSPCGAGIRLLGFVRDVRGVLSAADLLVMPSRWEGFGLSAAEAMAAGLPIIATDVAGLRDVVTGQEGLIVPPDDPPALAAAMDRLAESAELRWALGAAGRARAGRLFDIRDNIAAHERLYEELAG